MKKWKIGMAACLLGLMLLGGAETAKADSISTSRALAGLSVALNNFNACSLNPQEELAVMILPDSLKEAVQLAQQNSTEVIETTAPNPYANIAISSKIAEDGYVNIRTEPNTGAEIIGKIKHNCAATILDTVDGENGEWYLIRSGRAEGYIKADLFSTGEEAEVIAEQVGTVLAVVAAAELRLREEPSLDDSVKILDLLPIGAEHVVIESGEEWTKIEVDADLQGYVYNQCIAKKVVFEQAITIEEEEEMRRQEEERQRAYEEAQRLLEEARKAEESRQASIAESIRQSSIAASIAQQQQQQRPQPPAQTTPAPTTPPFANLPSTELRNAVVAFAKQYEGGRYVWGGEDLNNGVDCSGFVMMVYRQFGVNLPHYSGSQANCGTRIPLQNVRPGDLVFYSSNGGVINHVGMYIGNGKLIHAANEYYGICIWDMYYRTPVAAVSLLP